MRPPPMSSRERLLVWLATCVGLPVAMLVLAGPTLFTRAFWSDEVLSWLIASDGDLGHGLAALAGGVDTNAPLLHLILHVVGNIFGHSPAVYRAVAAAGMSLAIAGFYFLLRRSFDVRPAVIGCLALLACPIVLTHTTEARFYSLFLAAALWSAYGLSRRIEGPTLGNAVALAFTSSALCGIHYFGVIALGCLVLCSFARARTMRQRLDSIYPSLAGFATTLALFPLLKAQRTAMAGGGGTWVPNVFFVNLQTTLAEVVPSPALLAFALLAFIATVAVGRSNVIAALRRVPTILWALPLYALALLVFDRLVQPVLVPRYFMLVLPAIAATAAALSNVLPARVGRTLVCTLCVIIASELAHMRSQIRAPSARSALGILASVSPETRQPIISDWLGFALPIWQSRPAARETIAYLPDTRLHEAGFDQAIRYERKMAEQVRLFYAAPRATSVTMVEHLDHFVLLSEFPESIHDRFPDFEVRQLGEITFELTRIDAAARSD